LERNTAKDCCDSFLNLKTILAVILLTATFCVLSCIVGTAYARANHRITLLSATVTEIGNLSNNKANKPVDNSKETQERFDEWQTVQMRVTAYCPCQKCCGKYSDGQTASGYKIRPGDAFVAADKKYSFGTEMIIAGYNKQLPVKVLDRGGAIRGNRLDVFFHSHQEALNWGVKYLNVKVHQRPQTK